MIVMWTEKYHNRNEFMAYFLTEQEYVDAMFTLIIMENFGIWLDATKLCRDQHGPLTDRRSSV